MASSIDWSSVARPLDVFDIAVPDDYIRRWTGYEETGSGVICHTEMANGTKVDVHIDIITDDVFRMRANPEGLRDQPSYMLVDEDQWKTPRFTLKETEDLIALTTDRIRVEINRFPWQVRAYDRADDALPFFEQRIDNRAYGPSYEVAPVGFTQDDGGQWTARETVAARPGEAFYGFGEKFTTLNRWDQELVHWAIDSGNVTSHRSYKNVPFFMSTAGYGMFAHSSFPMIFRMGTESSVTYSVHIADSQLDTFIIYGPDFSHILKRYAELTGFAPVPPKWSFGFWISRCMYRSREEVENVVQGMRDRSFPCDVLSIDPWWMGEPPWTTLEWDTDCFPEPAEMIEWMTDQHVRLCLWITPYVPEGTTLYEEGVEKGYFIRDAEGEISPALEAFAGGESAPIDFTDSEQSDWYTGKLEALLDMGVSVFKTDFGEQAPIDAVYADGRSGLEMHNIYPLLYNGAVFNLTQHKFGRGLTWGRSAYAGSQRYPLQWGGDSYASLPEMQGQIRALLGYGMSGVPFASHDVGGFDYQPAAFDHAAGLEMGDHIFNTEALEAYPRSPVVYIRWLQFGVFSSHIRAHGKGPQEPWEYGEEAELIVRQYLNLRYRLLPYIYSEAVRSSQSGLPVVRAMPLAFQHDPTTHNLEMQYMFGESFLVAPVTNEAGRCRVYLPAGDWVDFWTHEIISGPRWLDVEVPLETLPLWVKAGSIIPLGPEMTYVGEKPLDPLTLAIYAPGQAGELVIHDEDQPDITARYTRIGSRLTVEVSAAPGDVVVELYGVQVDGDTSARQNGQVGGTFTFEIVESA